MRNLKHNKNGVTLVALVITIIVMLILVGVGVKAAIDAGLIGKAGEAVTEYSEDQGHEKNLSKGLINVNGEIYNIDGYLNRER